MMEARVITGAGRLDVIEVPEPEPAPGVAVVAIERCGICGTDVSAYRSGEPYPPFLSGHEWCGTVVAVGPGVTHLAEGDRAVCGSPPACGACAECRAGLTDRCARILDVRPTPDSPQPVHGGYAPRIAVNAGRLIPIPADLPAEDAAQVEPATVALHGVRRSPLRVGDIAVVQGAGPIGLFALQLAKLAGASRVVAVEPQAHRRALATDLGADHAIAPGDAAVELLRDLTDGLGADVVYECSGAAGALDTAALLARPGGNVTMLGVPGAPVTVDPRLWLARETTVAASLAHTNAEFAMTLALLADGRLQVRPLHDRTIGLGELDETLAALASGESRLTKVLVDPSLEFRHVAI